MHRTELHPSTPNVGSELLCTILDGPPGSGKTAAMLAEIARHPARYLLAAPRTALVDEHVASLRSFGVSNIDAIHSDQGIRGTVERRVRESLDKTAEHIVVVTTHASVMGLGCGDVDGWHVRLDELPEAAIVSDSVGLAASWPSLAERYDLVAAKTPGWSALVPRPSTPTLGLGQLADDVAAVLVPMHRIAASRGRTVEVDLERWENAGAARCRVRWRSIWSVAALRGCASLQIAAAGWSGSLAERAAARDGGVRVDLKRVGSPRTGQPQIRIHWFTGHTGSTSWWETDEGERCLVRISQYLERVGFAGYWACNKSVRPYFAHRFAAPYCRPRMAGTNSLRHHASCAMIYSAKATPADGAIIDAFEIDRDVLCNTREDEDIFQMVTRGAIRDFDYDGPYEIYVYDAEQAERLRTRLIEGGYTDVAAEPVPEAGILDVERPAPRGAQDAEIDPEAAARKLEAMRDQEAERGRRRRAAAKAVKIADGTYRGPGKPRRPP